MTFWPRDVEETTKAVRIHSNRLKRTKMLLQFRWFDFDQIGFYVFDHSIAHVCRQRIDYRGMD